MISRKFFSLKCSSTISIAICLLVVGSTFSSLLLFFFHYKISFWQQPYDQRHNYHDFGPPRVADHPQSNLSQSQSLNRTKKASVFGLNEAVDNIVTYTRHDTSASKERKVYNVSDRECFSSLNSLSWLRNKRLGNQNSDDSRIIDDNYVVSSILNINSLFSDAETNSQQILRSTICAKSSRFLNLKFSNFRGKDDENLHENVGGKIFDEKVLHQLSFRLMYLSVHVHQHMHAMNEARHRLNNPRKCEREMSSRNIGKFDFECPGAKFLVVPMKHSGLGGQVRLITAPALMAGIASDRVVLFVNNSPVGPKFLREPWDLSSCPRRDKQCFFLPDSPCVLTHNEIQNATVLGTSERRTLFKTGELPKHLDGERVIVMNMKDRPQRTPPNFRTKIADIARQFLINPLASDKPGDPSLVLLSAAADHILQEDEGIGDLFYYYGRNFQAHHAMVFFAMRPKAEFAERINYVIEGTLGNNHKTNLALGLPIRASDKCIDESECPSFETYMLLMQNIWDTNKKNLVDVRRTIVNSTENPTPHTKIILTSESSDVLQAQKAYQEHSNTRLRNLSFPFKFVTNTFDVLQNTGNPSKMSTSRNSKEEILLSSLTSLKMQLYAKYIVGNCCSNHHLLLFDLLTEGCGASDSDHVTMCMQDHDDQRFRICCGWTKSTECLERVSQRKTLNTSN